MLFYGAYLNRLLKVILTHLKGEKRSLSEDGRHCMLMAGFIARGA
jgi:hypothetical protein